MFCCLLLPSAALAAEQCLAACDGGGPQGLGKPSAVPPERSLSGSTARNTGADGWSGSVLGSMRRWYEHAALSMALLCGVGWLRQWRRSAAQERVLNHRLLTLRALLDGVPHPVYLCDRQGRLVDCNSSFLQAEDASREQLLGRPPGMVAAQVWRQARDQVLGSGQAWERECCAVLADGRHCRLSHWLRPAPGGQWVAAGWVDTTERPRGGRRTAETAERLLDHLCQEARGSLGNVLGMLERALPQLAQRALEYQSIDQAARAARDLSAQLSCAHDAWLLQAGKRVLAMQPVSLREHFSMLVEVCEQRWRSRGWQLPLDYQGPSRVIAQLDPVRVQQLVSCVLAHVFRFTHQGRVRLGLKVMVVGAGVRLRLRIESAAKGMNEEDLALSIGRALCASMGGQLRAGRRRIDIRMRLPAASVGAAPARSRSTVPASSPRLRVLVVDDHPANRLLLCLQLRRLGHLVEAAEDGGQAIRACVGRPFDVVISDCGMPVMDGYALARAIRLYESRQGLRPCLLVGVSGRSTPFGMERCLAAGMDQCLLKPMTLAQLHEVLLWHERGPDAEEGGAIDLGELERLTAGNSQALTGLLEDLLQANRDDLRRLRHHAQRCDLGALANLAHRIKGGVRIIKAWGLVEACERLEHCCGHASTDDPEVKARLMVLMREVLWLEVRLRRYRAHHLLGNSV